MVSHRGIPSNHQAIQATHAAIELAKSVGVEIKNPNLVHVTCRDGPELKTIAATLRSNNIRVFEFEEPYNNWGLTSISCLLGGEQRLLLSHLPLWKP